MYGTYQTGSGQAVTTTVNRDAFGNLIDQSNGQQVYPINAPTPTPKPTASNAKE